MALLLQKRGITRIRPLAGGIDLWLESKFPFESAAPIASVSMSQAETVSIDILDQKA